jgi:putative DNA primase/helicase
MIDLRILQRALGGDIVSGQVLCPGPGHDRRDRSLAVRPRADGEGFVVYSHAGDDWRDCQAYVRQMLGWPRWQPGDGRDRDVPQQRVQQFDRHVGTCEARQPYNEEELVRIRRAQVLWADATDPRGTLAEAYVSSRALRLTDDVAGDVLRFQLACPFRDEDKGETAFVPALVVAFRAIADNAVTAVHRIRLDHPERWPKAQRKMFGVVRGSAVKLDPIGETLALGEGTETCLAARRLGYAPAWALGSVANIRVFPVIDGVSCLRILGETGAASANAIEHCAERWLAAGRKVQVVMPDDDHSDLNDELMASNKEREVA